jgi:mycothiol system anti-sigma-R factor
MIDCPEAVRRMWDYLEQALEPKPSQEFETHLDTCKRCCGELEFSRRMREMVADRASPPPIPPDLRARLEGLLAGGPDAPDSKA